ncbi:hypothetical protein AXG93_812s1170 [Marchantia polymorpha subsp. ruderalis]|uniref:Uncharacterized protein n=1 Tax=Marchantia polymorpha subsp. ruderalis TaxID=1480154 RepID=A0A176VZF7_MARPO|nr:hypothetical protein AXG93_812s1170 [Marchantia polymorpha subsp. ruderalis]
MGKNQAYKAMQRAKMASHTAAGGPDEIDDGMEDAKRQGELEDDEARMMREYRAQLDAERARKLARGKNHLDKREKLRKEKKEKEKEKSRSGKKRKVSDSPSESPHVSHWIVCTRVDRASGKSSLDETQDTRTVAFVHLCSSSAHCFRLFMILTCSRCRQKSSKRRRGKSDADSDSETSSSDEDEREYRKERRKSKKDKKDKKHKSRRKRSRSSSDESSSDREESGPLPLSCYFENGK